MNRHDIAHRFANMDFGKNGSLKAGNVSCSTKNYYSYSTIFGQWVDKDKKVCIVYQGDTSSSSRTHQLYKGMFPEDVHVFPYDDGGSYFGWHGCNLVGYGTFDWHSKRSLLDYWIDTLYEQFSKINGGKTKGLDKVNFKYWDFVEELCGLYKDVSISKWLKAKRIALNKESKKMWAAKRKMVRLLSNGERDVRTITDALFGEGTFQCYWDYCERYRKQAHKKAQMEWLCNRLHIRYPYGRDWSSERIGHGMSVAEIRKMTAKERNEIHFAALAKIEENKHEEERKKKYSNGFRNAYKYIIGEEPVIESRWASKYDPARRVINRFTGEVYETPENFEMPSFMDWKIEFNFDEYRNSLDKEDWIRQFYATAKKYSQRVLALNTLIRIEAHKHEKNRLYEPDRYINDDYLRENTTEEVYHLCVEYINAVEQYYAEEEARRRAAILRQEREREEREKERKLQESIRQEQIDQLISQGVEGCRNLWRSHFMDICKAEYKSVETAPTESFYDGGNVLLRFNLNKDTIETSKHIRINIPTCKKMWRIVKVWHEDPSKFRQLEIKTLSGTYTIISYENDILTAGCHKIAYAEMERMHNAIMENEKTA